MKVYAFLILLFALATPSAFGQNLFYDKCVDGLGVASHSLLDGAQIYFVSNRGGVMGLSCQDLSGMKDAIEDVKLALYPATLAVLLSPAKGQLLATLAELGLTMANPAVLGVTVLAGASGAVMFLVLKQTMRECERMEREELRQAIVRELEMKYGIDASRSRLDLVR